MNLKSLGGLVSGIALFMTKCISCSDELNLANLVLSIVYLVVTGLGLLVALVIYLLGMYEKLKLAKVNVI